MLIRALYERATGPVPGARIKTMFNNSRPPFRPACTGLEGQPFMNETLHARRTARHAWLAVAVAAGAVAAVAGRVHVSATDSGYHRVDNWPQVPPSMPMGFVSWVAFDAHDTAFVFRRCPVKCADGSHPAG